MRSHPRFEEEYGSCDTCGRCFPVSQLVRNRWGWQCREGNFRGYSCRDDNIQGGDVRYLPRAGEGTRSSAAPACPDIAETFSDTDEDLRLRDRADPTTVYRLIMDEYFGFEEVTPPPYGVPAIMLNGGYYLTIMNGYLELSPIAVPGAWRDDEIASRFYVSTDGFLQYTAP